MAHVVTQLNTVPYWVDAVSLPRFPKIRRDQRVDVVVVGGGCTGLTAAYLLTKAGKSVALLERTRCASIDTGHTSAHLTMVTDARISDLVKAFGRDHAQAAWDAGLFAIATIDSVIRDEDIECAFEWVDGYLHGPLGERADARAFEKEAAVASDLGFDAALVEQVPFVGGPGVRFEGQARFHPRAYLAGLARAIHTAGGDIYEHSAAEEFCAAPLSVKANGFTLTCDDIFIATHNPLVGVADMAVASKLQTKLSLYTSYVIAGRVPKGTVPDSLFWDTASAYHFLRIEPHRSFDVVIFGGEDHKTGQADDTPERYERLARTLGALIPRIEITHHWSGQVIDTPDGLPFIGTTAPHQHLATGFNGNGLTFGTLGATMATDAILGRTNPWAELLEPNRSILRHGGWRYLVENSDYPWYKMRDRFVGAEAKSLRTVKRGQGKVIERNGAKVAAYRDETGTVTLRSATCTHMGCVVGWNEAERTWDCPCHGSRFKPDGSVISGPAEDPLEKVE